MLVMLFIFIYNTTTEPFGAIPNTQFSSNYSLYTVNSNLDFDPYFVVSAK